MWFGIVGAWAKWLKPYSDSRSQYMRVPFLTTLFFLLSNKSTKTETLLTILVDNRLGQEAQLSQRHRTTRYVSWNIGQLLHNFMKKSYLKRILIGK